MSAQAAPVPGSFSAPDVSRIQRRTLTLLVGTQIVGGVGVAIGISVGALLVGSMAGAGLSGLASSAGVVGAALLTVPVTRITRIRGRRSGLAAAYLVGAAGALVVVAATVARSVPLVLLGMLLFGGGSTANLQARYAAADLAEPARRGRQLSLVVWATTVGAVAGPNLAPPADRALSGLRLPEYAGPFACSVLAFCATAGAVVALLRPDPLLTARALAATRTAAAGESTIGESATGRGAGTWRRAAAAVRGSAGARLGIVAITVGHAVMVAVMSMTPLHIHGYVTGHADMLRIVGLVLSAHIAGMYALAPAVGWLTDRFGRRAVVLGGAATLLVSCAVAGTAGPHTPQLTAGLVLLGLGWSGTMVAGSTLLSESVDPVTRPSAQGLADLVMGLAGALAAALAGAVVGGFGYPVLAWCAAVPTVPLILLAVRWAPASEEGVGRGAVDGLLGAARSGLRAGVRPERGE